MASTCHTLFFLLLLLLPIFIDGSPSLPCPSSIYFHCPDGRYNRTFLEYPFTNSSFPWCGHCMLRCENNTTKIQCGMHERSYQVLNISTKSHSIVLNYTGQDESWKQHVYEAYENVSIPSSASVSVSQVGFEAIIRCPNPGTPNSGVQYPSKGCQHKDDGIVCGPYPYDTHQFHPLSEPGCTTIILPNITLNPHNFTLQYNFAPPCWQCVDDGGRCYDGASDPNGSPCPRQGNGCFDNVTGQLECYSRGMEKTKLAIILGSVLSGCLVIILGLLVLYWQQRKTKSDSSNLLPSLEMGSINGVIVFSYHELEEATNNFNPTRELGKGGFGIVYHGKLSDGREVAVKRLYEKNYRQIEQFKNEIYILTGLCHKNLVTLYGCTCSHSRELLLVYEYIPNGTVADHLHSHHGKSELMTWSTRMDIAIETAEALSYLHSKDIIHRDVKTKNILLGNDFCVKVADFGLSRLFPTDVTHVSTAPQGTPGYLDPEYHQCYRLTDKSDVYSFGVVLVELISSLPAVDIGRHKHEINLSNYAMNKIRGCAFNELVDPNLGFESDIKVRRMTILVGELAFQCLQDEKELRPSMDEVLQALMRIASAEYDAVETVELSTGTTKVMTPLLSPMNNDGLVLMRNAQRPPPPSPDSVTNKWLSLSASLSSPTNNDAFGPLKNSRQPTSTDSVMDTWLSKSSTSNTSG